MALSKDSDINFDIWKNAMESLDGPDISIHEIGFSRIIINSNDVVA